MLTAKEVMTSDVVTVTIDTTVRELGEIFAGRKISSVPVVDGDGLLVGIVTETDLIEQDKNLHIPTVVSIFDWVIYLESDRKFERELHKMTGQIVGDIYSKEVDTVTPDTAVSDIADLLANRKITAVPVVDAGRVVGMVARIDLIRSMIGNR